MAEPIVIGEGGGGNRRVLQLAAVAAVVLVAAFVLPKLLFGGGGGSEVDAFPPVPTTVPGLVAPTPGESPAETFETFDSKNPFEPLLVADEGSTAPAASTTPTTVPVFTAVDPMTGFPVADPNVVVDPGTWVPGVDYPTIVDPSATPTTTVPPAPALAPSMRVALLEVYTDPTNRTVASVRVGDITYTVGEQDDFAQVFRVTSLDSAARCGTFLYADESFGLCEGNEILK